MSNIIDLAALFLRLGTTAFGGPAAHIAMTREEVVRKRQWLTDQDFLDLISACNLIPGPNSTEMAIHIGHRRAGVPGLVVAGCCFILPAAIMVTLIAWAYVKYSHLPEMHHVMNGIKPVVIAIVLHALLMLANAALKTKFLKLLIVPMVVWCFFSLNEILVLLVGGALSLVASWRHDPKAMNARHALIALGVVALAALGIFVLNSGWLMPSSPQSFSLQNLFLYFAKVGSVLYGSGYVLLAFLRNDLVQNWHWLTPAQLLDATAVGQITPGPVFTTATFIGYLLGGLPGAVVATVGIFLPSFFFVGVTAPFVDRARKSALVSALLDGVNVASLALMAFVTYQLARDAITTPVSLCELLVSAFVLWRFNVNPTWLIAVGAIIGVATSL